MHSAAYNTWRLQSKCLCFCISFQACRFCSRMKQKIRRIQQNLTFHENFLLARCRHFWRYLSCGWGFFSNLFHFEWGVMSLCVFFEIWLEETVREKRWTCCGKPLTADWWRISCSWRSTCSQFLPAGWRRYLCPYMFGRGWMNFCFLKIKKVVSNFPMIDI